jgi:Ca2+/Na+ antiporter
MDCAFFCRLLATYFLPGAAREHKRKESTIHGRMQVRDVLVYTLAVAFMLYVLDAARITRSYVAFSFLAYICYVLSVLTADFHHRGWMPYQPARLSKRLARSTRRGGGLLRWGRHTKGLQSPRGPRLLSLAKVKVSKLKGVAGTAGSTAAGARGVEPPEDPGTRGPAAELEMEILPHEGKGATGYGEALEGLPSAGPLETLPALALTLPVSNPSSTSRPTSVHSFTHLSIEHTCTAPVAAAPWHAALGRTYTAISALCAPLCWAQTWSIPCSEGSGDQGNRRTPPAGLLLKSFLACQVMALYFRARIDGTGWLWLTSVSAAALLVLWAAISAITALHHGPSPAELQLTSNASYFHPDDKATAVEKAYTLSGTNAFTDSPPNASSSLPSPAMPTSHYHNHSAVLCIAQEPRLHCHASHIGSPTCRPLSDSLASTPQPPRPLMRRALLTFDAVVDTAAFIASIIWIQLIAEELVALLVFIGSVLSVDHTLLGVTILAWGAWPFVSDAPLPVLALGPSKVFYLGLTSRCMHLAHQAMFPRVTVSSPGLTLHVRFRLLLQFGTWAPFGTWAGHIAHPQAAKAHSCLCRQLCRRLCRKCCDRALRPPKHRHDCSLRWAPLRCARLHPLRLLDPHPERPQWCYLHRSQSRHRGRGHHAAVPLGGDPCDRALLQRIPATVVGTLRPWDVSRLHGCHRGASLKLMWAQSRLRWL